MFVIFFINLVKFRIVWLTTILQHHVLFGTDGVPRFHLVVKSSYMVSLKDYKKKALPYQICYLAIGMDPDVKISERSNIHIRWCQTTDTNVCKSIFMILLYMIPGLYKKVECPTLFASWRTKQWLKPHKTYVYE